MKSDPTTPITERSGYVAGVPVHWREASPEAGRAPVLYLHGVPTHSADWVPFLERTGGVAPDLPGFGASGKPAEFDYSIPGYERFLAAFVDHLGLERFSLVVHDWGGVGLALAQEMPERVERLVVMNCVPLLPGYSWHRLARIWRRRGLGELAMGATTRRVLSALTREATTRPGPMPEEFLAYVWEAFDQGTQRAILRLYRSAPSEVLAEAGRRLGDVRCPALVLWGEEDPYIDTAFADAYARALGGPARLDLVAGASHWPWIDRPEVLDTVAGFLSGGGSRSAATR
ncbi:MAG: alpha/beta fold hydrolase [Thermoleophilaceae bacterium]